MKTSSLKHVAPRAVERYTQDANAQVFNAIGGGSPANPNFYATGGAASAAGQTYVINVSNSNAVASEEVILFGWAKFANVARFGSGANITVTMGTSNLTYAQMLFQSGVQPFEVALTRIETSSQTQLQTSLLFNYQDATGTTYAKPLVVSSYKSPDQFQNNMIDYSDPYQINANTYLSFTVQPSTQVRLSLFVSAQVNVANPISGQAAIEEATKINVNTFRG